MIGKKDRWQEDLFIACPLRDLIPEDHILKRVDKVLDLSWLRREVRDCYDEAMGRRSIDPESALRLMLAGLFEGIIHDRKLMVQAHVNMAIRWFAGYRLDEALPDHSSLSKIRLRWGAERFKRIFVRTVNQCVDAGLVSAETVHLDATLIRADVSWRSLTERHAEQVMQENPVDGGPEQPEGSTQRGGGRSRRRKSKKYSKTDADATMATSSKNSRLEPTFKQHTAVDDKAGVVVDVGVTTGEVNEGGQLLEQIDRVEANTGRKVKTATADAGYAHSRNYMGLENREIDGVIPPQAEQKRPKRIPARRFKYDGKHKTVRCPAGKVLNRSHRDPKRWIYRARACDCRDCPLRSRCVPPSAKVRTIGIADGHEALVRARRRKQRGWDEQTEELYRRHRWRVEGVHGEAKKWHHLGRAQRRGLWNVEIQAYLTAAVMNLKRLAGLAGLPAIVRAAIRHSAAALLAILRLMQGFQTCLTVHRRHQNQIWAVLPVKPRPARQAA